ncbi:hypothetical protein JCGZ_11947 [Jatropha curcas]|uniref:Aminotransferase-like plant mobile domain-containing protein n=1 Tax=Jatropha curcas TaxID=180498 RepID=A0A067KS31_JATCU|nr:hypothetical protein JCGZ_11947 [Jatropha curcas]
MTVERVLYWLPSDTVIDLVTQPMSHGMKLREFIIPDARTAISLQHDFLTHVCWGSTQRDMITPVDFATIIGLPFRGRSIIFYDQLRALDRQGLRESLRATIGMEPTISDQMRYESIISHYKTMPRECLTEMDVDVVARACLFYLLSTTLFTNHGNDADLALLPPLQDLDLTRQFN